MAKTWALMSDAEKIKDLRADVIRVFGALREMASEQDRLRGQVFEAIKRLDLIASKIEKL
jgi:hypothetical protein